MRRRSIFAALFLLLALAPARLFARDHSKDIAIIDRALKSAKPADPWVKFGDVGIKYSDLKTYRDNLAANDSKSSGPQPLVVTPAGNPFWTGGNVNYRFDPIGLTNGAIFKMTPAGVITTLHAFTGTGTDGANPVAGLVRVGNTDLYGTTQLGGSFNKGTVFKVTTSGTGLSLFNSGWSTLIEGIYGSGGLVQIIDPSAIGVNRRFYRLVLEP